MNASDQSTPKDFWQEMKKDLEVELDQVRSELKEINMMVEQSQLEVSKLAQRNASINSRLQQVQGQFESMPREDIRQAYDSALDAQQRLFVMRGQVEKLQGDQSHLQRYESFLEKVVTALEGNQPQVVEDKKPKATADTLEIMIQSQEAERQRLSRQMHDGPAQALSNFILQTEIAMRLFDMDKAKAKQELASLKSSATDAFQQVREFIFELRPMMLDDLGLTPTIKRYIEAMKAQIEEGDILLQTSGMDRRLEPYIEVFIFRAIQELLTNAIRHSHASQIKLQVNMGEANIKVVLEDNGSGFDIALIEERGNMGLKVIRERVEMLGGAMDIDSVPGKGTRITFQIPAVAPGELT